MNTTVTAISIMNAHTWSDHALTTTNSIAGMVALVAAGVLLLSLWLLYFSGSALSSRISAPLETSEPRVAKAVESGERRNGNSRTAESQVAQANGEKAIAENQRKVDRLTKELTEARLAAEARRSDVAKLQRDLAEAQKSDKAKTERVARLENDFETVRRSEQDKTSRVAQLEEQLGTVQKGESDRASRVTQLEKDLEATRKALAQQQKDLEAARKTSAQKEKDLDEARKASAQKEKDLEEARKASAQKEKDLEVARKASTEKAATASVQSPVAVAETARTITQPQREQFLHAIQGRPTGKVIVSAFFENKQTHDFGKSVIALLKTAGFEVIEQAPVNFFTTSRPSSGVRIGCENMSQPPRHFVTLRAGFEAMGIEIPDASIVNAQDPDVVEIQITPKE